ncbi:hypothetical protein BN159_3278 [Streptomyces davaonensis JCM 4913]|uniref:Peptidoglycan binding domain-containing protein n=1 Tax=Streptomyces davaonensis (strain DSM 101723 / JCM 4913 / KCC S-0913 / 768) TaxID=1214101 RepID=K4R3D9_STRDJ|nr:hypothetical protein [Streptomyces davaonensis]CCK27657.1 hypothetical protein BN159_3278 [Streptomyces davaonensis JCM 4913]
MSRETDSPSSGPNGRGGAAYPSGTPPYGTPAVPDAGPDAGRSAARPEERKTETTLTTRIRINIPGSRPIPPVVVRKPVGETESSAASTEPEASAARAPEPPAEPAAPAAEEKPASGWFAPRKSSAPKAGPGGGQSNGAGTPGGSGAAPSGARPAAGAAPSAPRPGSVTGSMNLPGGPRPGATNGAGLPGATGGPVAPGHGGGTGSFDVTEALAAGPLGGGPRPGDEPRRDDLPYFSDNGQHGYAGQGAPGGPNGFNGPGGPGGPAPVGGPHGPAGPTTGPVTGDGPVVPPVSGGPAAAMGAPGMHAPGGGLSDDTAILTPQKPAPEPGTPGYGNPADNVSGHTVTSGIPVVPPAAAQHAPFGPGAHTDGPLPHTPPRLPEPVAQPAPAAPAPKKKKGRGKSGLLIGGVVVLGGGLYGAGLLMNHSDVPKGTTVLGVDIGGGTRDDAVQKLDDAFGERVNKELKLTVGGKTVTLKPDQAGLQLDAAATVSEAAQSDYNPVSVIGSLFGQQRVVEPVMPVDEEKLAAALENAGGGSGSVTEGTIKFDSGKAVAVYGKAGKGIDAAKSADAVEEAYRTQVETGAAPAVSVETTAQQPTISNAEVDRMMKEFAEPAMSDLATVQTDAAHRIQFGKLSLPKILGVKAVDGKLVDTYDLDALKEAYGTTFDGVLITRGTGKKTAVTPEDVVSALRQALRGKTTADRTAVIDTNPS